jgi:hypothetical protein
MNTHVSHTAQIFKLEEVGTEDVGGKSSSRCAVKKQRGK